MNGMRPGSGDGFVHGSAGPHIGASAPEPTAPSALDVSNGIASDAILPINSILLQEDLPLQQERQQGQGHTSLHQQHQQQHEGQQQLQQQQGDVQLLLDLLLHSVLDNPQPQEQQQGSLTAIAMAPASSVPPATPGDRPMGLGRVPAQLLSPGEVKAANDEELRMRAWGELLPAVVKAVAAREGPGAAPVAPAQLPPCLVSVEHADERLLFYAPVFTSGMYCGGQLAGGRCESRSL